MAVVIVQETGAGNDSTANSYITLAECSQYHEEMGNPAWAAAATSPDDARLSALVRGSRAIDRIYGKRFVGRPYHYGVQAFEWPRIGAQVAMEGFFLATMELATYFQGYIVPSNIIPPEVKKACCEAALLELASVGIMTAPLDRGGKIKSVQAGSVGVTYMDNAPSDYLYPAIDGILRPLLKNAGCDLQLG